MKQFFLCLFATIVGIALSAVVLFVLGLAVLIGLDSEGSSASISSSSVLVISLDGTISERGSGHSFSSLLGGDDGAMGLDALLSAIDNASRNSKIEGIYLEGGVLQTGYSSARTLRNALLRFKSSGKWIVAYGNLFSQGAYYVASVADSVYLNPSGQVDLHGVSSRVMYVKDLYAKLGIHFQIFKVGQYKSATEAYSEERMSAADRAQMTVITAGLWREVKGAIAASRGIEEDSIDALADRFTLFLSADELMRAGLIDGLLYGDEMQTKVKRLVGIADEKTLAQVSVATMSARDSGKSRGGEIAVYYAEGEMVDDALPSLPFSDDATIVGSTVSRDLLRLANDDAVKAVVLRVNSPGGSAYAAELIWHSVAVVAEHKPVVVSMGDYAASGGYYISCNASWIVAEPTTLTGSIGIFGVLPEGQELLEKKLGLHFDGVQTNKHADLGGSVLSLALRPFDSDECALLQDYIDRGYALFRQRVADGRQMAIDSVEAIAQGRVWLGEDALRQHLVDQLGGIDVAITKAAEMAQLDDYHTVAYPATKGWLDLLLGDDDDEDTHLSTALRSTLGEWYEPFILVQRATKQYPLQARLPFLLTVD